MIACNRRTPPSLHITFQLVKAVTWKVHILGCLGLIESGEIRDQKTIVLLQAAALRGVFS